MIKSTFVHCGELTVRVVIQRLNEEINYEIERKKIDNIVNISHSIILNSGGAYEATAIITYNDNQCITD